MAGPVKVEVRAVMLRPVHFIALNIMSNVCVGVSVVCVAGLTGSAWALLGLAFLKRPDASLTWKKEG